MMHRDDPWRKDTCFKCRSYSNGYCRQFRQPVDENAAQRCGKYDVDLERIESEREDMRQYVRSSCLNRMSRAFSKMAESLSGVRR